MGSCLLNFLLVRVKLLTWWDFCRFFKVLLEQLLKFLLITFKTVYSSGRALSEDIYVQVKFYHKALRYVKAWVLNALGNQLEKYKYLS